jgi:hypothetical protein
MISMMLMAEQVLPFASSVMALLKRIAQRTTSVVGRACKPLGLVTWSFRVNLTLFDRDLSAIFGGR